MILHIHSTGTPFFHILKRDRLKEISSSIVTSILEILEQIQPHYFSIAQQVLTLETENRFSEELKTKSLDQVLNENFSFKYSVLWSVFVQLNPSIEKIASYAIVDFFLLGFLTLREGKRGPHRKPIIDHYKTWVIYTLFTISQDILGIHELHKNIKVDKNPAIEQITVVVESVNSEDEKDDISQLRIRRPTMLLL